MITQIPETILDFRFRIFDLARRPVKPYVTHSTKSSENYDLHDKLQVYRRPGVCEYLVVRVRDAQIDWFRLVKGRYELIQPDGSGIVKSSVFPGLWLDPAAMLKGDLARVFTVLQAGLASPVHANFLAALQARRAER